MWYDLSKAFDVADHSTLEWMAIAAVNLAFYLFMITIAPRLRAIMRAWRRWEDVVGRRFSEFYGALGGPRMVARNVVPEICLIVYCYLGAMCLWIFLTPLIGIVFFALAFVTFMLWRGIPLAVQTVRWIVSRRQSIDENDHLTVGDEEVAAASSDIPN